MKHDFLCMKIINMLYENQSPFRICKEIRALMDFTTLENIEKYDIMETRGNKNVHWTKGEHGYFTGSVGSGNTGVFIKEINKPFVITDAQLGKKIGRHILDFGLDPQKKEDRDKFTSIICDIVKNHNQPLKIGDWRGQADETLFFIKDLNVVVTKQNGEFVTILKGGVTNARVKRARNF